MAFPAPLAATMTGTSTRQLYDWRRKGLLRPELQSHNPPLYSFRDLVAIRTVAYLRAHISLQKIRSAFATLREFEYNDHPSAYKFGTDGKTIAMADESGQVLELVGKKGQILIFTLDQVFEEFTNRNDELVVNFEHPRENIELDPGTLGGWPTIRGTRVPYDSVAQLFSGGDYSPEEVGIFFPTVSVAGVLDALDFNAAVQEKASRAA